MQHINKIEQKSHDHSRDAEKNFDKIQNPFEIKSLKKLGR
jgi:hypothetical protein